MKRYTNQGNTWCKTKYAVNVANQTMLKQYAEAHSSKVDQQTHTPQAEPCVSCSRTMKQIDTA